MTTLQALRGRSHLTQQELAEKAGVGRTTIAKLESGKGTARPDTVRRLAQALGTDPLKLQGLARRTRDGREPGPREVLATSSGATPIEQSGMVDYLPDGTCRILLDEYIPEQVQVELFGRSIPDLHGKTKTGLFRPPNGAYTSLHVRTVDPDVLHTIAVEAEDPPSLECVTSRGVVLSSVWIDPGDQRGPAERCCLAFIPWDRVLGVSTMLRQPILEPEQKG